jgi:hypothetical protein
MNRNVTAIAMLIAPFTIAVIVAIAAPVGQAHGLQAQSRGGTNEEISHHSANAAEAAELPPQDPARGLTYEGIQPGPVDGPCEGLFELRPEEGELQGCTHGPDPSPADVHVGEPRSIEQLAVALTDANPDQKPPAPPVPCIEDFNGQTGNRVQAIYAYASDLPGGNRYAQSAPLIGRMAAEVDQVFYESAKETGGRRHVRFVTDAKCQLMVDVVRLSPTGDDDFGNTIKELQGRGYTLSDRKYLVWMDANPSDSFSDYCGIGQEELDDRPGKDNVHNGSYGISRATGKPIEGMFARVDPGCWGGLVEAHELMHTLGGVQRSAPHASVGVNGNGAFGMHCTDEWDRMCYDDDLVDDGWNRSTIIGGDWDGTTFERRMTYECDFSHDERFDCGHDDYYHTSPPLGSYLATHWNTAKSSFLSSQYFDRDGPEVTAPIHELADPLGVSTLQYSLSWSARDASGIREFHLWQYKESLSTPGAWSSSLVIPSGAGLTGNWIQRSFTWPLLPGHGYKFAVRAVDWAGNSSGWVYGDYFWVDAYDETSAAITYSGSWTRVTANDYFGGGTRRTNAAGAQASFTFYGSFIAWVGTLAPNGGSADVYLDGTYVKTVVAQAAASTASYRRVLFSKRYQCPPGQCGSHTITIRAAGGADVDTDAFVVEENGS